jgi:DNA-binding transcriptional ArsR family regulator
MPCIMAPRTKVSDETLLRAVGRLQTETGTCSYRQLGRAIGLSPTAVYSRVKTLRGRGLVEVMSGDGSIRLPQGIQQQLVDGVIVTWVTLQIRHDPRAIRPITVSIGKGDEEASVDLPVTVLGLTA